MTAPARSLMPDVLRGVAILGILAVNMQDFAAYGEWQQRGLDRAAQVLIDVFANGRFIALFALLFGWGLADVTLRRGLGTAYRRLGALLLIGVLHAALLWRGDVIAMYALTALPLPLLLRLKWHARTWAALGVALIGAWLLHQGGQVLADLAQDGPRVLFPQPFPDQWSYLDTVRWRVMLLPRLLLGSWHFNLPWLGGLFLVGAALRQAGLLARPSRHLPLLRTLALSGLPLGLLLGLGLAWANALPTASGAALSILLRIGGGLVMAGGYFGLIGLWLSRAPDSRLSRALAACGRLSLTHYLTQSLLMTLLFGPYGGSQGGGWGAAPALLLALGVAALQLAFSAWYVPRYGRGPLERALRWLVYGGAATPHRGAQASRR